MTKIIAVSKRGNNMGVVLTPHLYAGGFFVVTKGRHSSHARQEVFDEGDLPNWVAKGYGIRMSSETPKHSPSTFMPESLIVHPI